MKNLNIQFTKAKNDFRNSKGSEKSVENLYDIVYLLKDIGERNFEENYILAQIYVLLGKIIFAKKIIDKELVKSNLLQKMKFKHLLFKMAKLDNNWDVKIYRDLRDSKLIKEPTILNIEDFIVTKDIDNTFCIEISNRIKNIVILNKNIKNEDVWGSETNYFIYSEKEPTNSLLEKIVNYIKWLGEIKNELLIFYNESNFNHKIYNVEHNWFVGLDIFDFSVNIDKNNNFETEIILLDYLQNDFGFRLQIENMTLKSIEYDPII